MLQSYYAYWSGCYKLQDVRIWKSVSWPSGIKPIKVLNSFVSLPIHNSTIVPHFMRIYIMFKKISQNENISQTTKEMCNFNISLCFLLYSFMDKLYFSNHYASFIQPSVNFIHVYNKHHYYCIHWILMHCNMLRWYASYFSKLVYMQWCVKSRERLNYSIVT